MPNGVGQAAVLPLALMMHDAIVRNGRLQRGVSVLIQVLEATGGQGVDLVIDQVSGNIFNATQKATAVRGRIVNVGRLGGTTGEFDFNLHALRRIQYLGVTFRTRSAAEVRAIAARMREDLWSALESGRLRLPIDRIFSLAEADAAQAHMRGNRHFGKIVLRV